jgi:glycosyltransferase involved in cell wall biosynthesis
VAPAFADFYAECESLTRLKECYSLFIAIDAIGIRSGGGAIILKEILRWTAIRRPSWKIHVFTFPEASRSFGEFDFGPSITWESVNVDSVFGRFWWLEIGLMRRIRAIEADVLFCFANIGPAQTDVCQVVYCQQRLAIASTASSVSWSRRLKMAILGRLILRGCAHAQRVIVQTKSMKVALSSLIGDGQATKIAVVPGGCVSALEVDVEWPLDLPSSPLDPHPRCVYLSDLQTHKNHQTLIAAMPLILGRFPRFTLYLTIEEPRGVRKWFGLAGTLHRQIKRLKVGQNIVFLGTVQHSTAYRLLKGAELQIMPSLVESFGLPVIEAMAAGCPLIVADVEYAREVAGPAALYFDPLNSADLCERVFELLDDDDGRLSRRAIGIDAAKQFHFSSIVERLLKVIEAGYEEHKGRL